MKKKNEDLYHYIIRTKKAHTKYIYMPETFISQYLKNEFMPIPAAGCCYNNINFIIFISQAITSWLVAAISSCLFVRDED